MFSKKNFFTLFLIFLVILFMGHSAFPQTFPLSWPIGGPYPNITPYPFTTWPQQSYFPGIGISQTSGWPVYSPPPNYSPAPGGIPTSSTACPVGLVTGLTLEEEFGPGTSQITRCLIFRNNIKMLVHIDKFESSPGRPYGLTNILRTINDYEITNGTRDYKIVSINHSGGATQLLNINSATPHPDAALNVYQGLVEDLIAKGVKFYL